MLQLGHVIAMKSLRCKQVISGHFERVGMHPLSVACSRNWFELLTCLVRW
jgi:hypothetical protein